MKIEEKILLYKIYSFINPSSQNESEPLGCDNNRFPKKPQDSYRSPEKIWPEFLIGRSDQFEFKKGKETSIAIRKQRKISEKYLDVNKNICACFIER